MKGGLKLKHPSKTGFTPVYDMINEGTLSLLTAECAKGFMITLQVDPRFSEYDDIQNSRFVPITKFLLKFAVLAPDEIELDYYQERIPKVSETVDSYYNEAVIQQHVWKKSIEGERDPVCPSVANFSHFNNKDSKRLVQFLFSRFDHEVIAYLSRQVDQGHSIGVITMPLIVQTLPLYNFLGLYDTSNFHGVIIDETQKINALVSSVSQVIRLFIDTGVIHFDLHSRNILIYQKDGKIHSLLIDFGGASNIDDAPDKYLNENEKSTLKVKRRDVTLLLTRDISTKKSKDHFINTIVNPIADLDRKKNHQLFPNFYRSPDDYQMKDWFEIYKKVNLQDKTFDILKRDITIKGILMPEHAFNHYEEAGYFTQLRREKTVFPRCSDKSCVVSGGNSFKRTRKRKRKLF